MPNRIAMDFNSVVIVTGEEYIELQALHQQRGKGKFEKVDKRGFTF